MLQVIIPENEIFNEATGEFALIKKEALQLEHSLVSLSKWESKWKVPFLGKNNKTNEQIIDYIRCMTITQNVNPMVYNHMPEKIFKEILDYISDSMTATWFNESKIAKESTEVITSEIIYYWMITQNIPLECQKWHLNKLLTLIRVCSIKNAPPPKKRSQKEMLAERKQLNASRLNAPKP